MLLQLDLQQGKFFFSFFVSSVGFVISSSFNFFLSKDQGQMTQWRKKMCLCGQVSFKSKYFCCIKTLHNSSVSFSFGTRCILEALLCLSLFFFSTHRMISAHFQLLIRNFEGKIVQMKSSILNPVAIFH